MAATDNSAQKTVTAGHVSMMNDTLISNLPADQLKIILRRMLGTSHDVAALFVKEVRAVLSSQPLPTPPTSVGEAPYEDLRRLMGQAKVYLTAHMIAPALTVLAMFPPILQGVAPPLCNDLQGIMREAGGDMIQAAQAFKESGDKSKESETALRNLLDALRACKAKWGDGAAGFPFDRAIRQLVDAGVLVFPNGGFGDAHPVSSDRAKSEVARGKAKLKAPKKVEMFKLGDGEVPTLWWGLWQMSSSSWGSAGEEAIFEGMQDMLDNGLYAADMADHYGDAELIFGDFRKRYTAAGGERPFCATKYCQFKRVPANEVIDPAWVLAKVEERCRRVGGTVDLLQVHWQHLDDERYLDVFAHLISITLERPDLVRNIGLCNNDTKSLSKICDHLIKVHGAPGIATNQVQYSLVDSRPRYAMEEACRKYGVKLVTYGTFCGGLLSEKWLGSDAPNLYGGNLTISQRKYHDMIQAWGGWALFQELLKVLQKIAQKHKVDLANVAARWVLQQPATGAVIVGTRFGTTSHTESTMKTFDMTLDTNDLMAIGAIVDRGRAREMFEQIGDCGNEYR